MEGVNVIWKQKHATLFRRFDKGDKGFVTIEDMSTQIEIFLGLGSLTTEEGQEIREVYHSLWRTFFNESKKVDLEEWINGHRCLVESEDGSKVWDAKLKRAGSLMFRTVDRERRGVITQEEFSVYLKCLGVDDAEQAKEIFSHLDVDKKGELREEDFLKAFHEFNYEKTDTPGKELMGPMTG